MRAKAYMDFWQAVGDGIKFVLCYLAVTGFLMACGVMLALLVHLFVAAFDLDYANTHLKLFLGTGAALSFAFVHLFFWIPELLEWLDKRESV